MQTLLLFFCLAYKKHCFEETKKLTILLTFFLLHLLFFLFGSMINFRLFLEFKIGPFPITFYFDWISWYFSSFVLLISCLVLLYSNYYIVGDQYYKRFSFMLVLFVFSMVILIFRGRLFTIIIGWDGLGVVSFSLVIYYSDKEALISGLITIFTNRIGDALILVSIFSMAGSWNYLSLQGGIIFTIGAMTKRAQLPFSAWLPAAMSAPTPISALVHSSTLVTAGVYVIIRIEQLLRFIRKPLSLLALSTILLAGVIAILEKDFKKVIAISTLRQLGLMFFLLSLGAWKVCFFHILCHAIFKSIMFLRAGRFIVDGDQDMRRKGGLQKLQPLTSVVLVFAALSLIGIPFFSGFFSKDLAIDLIFSENFNLFSYFLFFIGCVLTALYSIRLMFPRVRKSFPQSERVNNIFLASSLPLLLIWAAWAGKILRKTLVIEDFNLISLHMKRIGLIIILCGVVIFLSQLISFKKLPSISLSFISGHFLRQVTLLIDNDRTYTRKGTTIINDRVSSILTKRIEIEKQPFLIWVFPLFVWVILCMI